ncbi:MULTISPECIES: acetyltransferase [Marinobacter]|uniref:Acetyltransferase n=1 Tax=Marinobacter profundi TaxID=2666256 RepID=A0A2G1UL09_9GAMM|nr:MULTISPECIES: acetyltransferase [Marinobacter]MBD3658286.1 acetyltransferase [Marinobacter sp.]PHQ15109.1 acetyltransferase [Marinobacter profundi]
MLLAEKTTGHLVEIQDLQALFNPFAATVSGCLHFGEEAQDPEQFDKQGLGFPSGEALPRCWTDPDYRRG